MEKRHEDYIRYYKARKLKYENNPMYKNAYEAENNMYHAISGISKLEEFKNIIETQKLNLKCAIALVKDKETARLKHFNELQETVRAKAPQQILAIIDSIQDVMDLTQKVSEIETKISREISIDLFVDEFFSDFRSLENIEIYANSNMPEGEWKQEAEKRMNEEIARFKERWETMILPENRKWQPDWDLNYDVIWEHRHRRKIPLSDEVIKKRIAEHKKYRGV